MVARRRGQLAWRAASHLLLFCSRRLNARVLKGPFVMSDLQPIMNNASLVIPTVIEASGRGERAYDLFSRLLRERIILVNGQIEDNLASLVVAELLFLASENSDREINMYINSPGGVITAGLAIYDTMRSIR